MPSESRHLSSDDLAAPRSPDVPSRQRGGALRVVFSLVVVLAAASCGRPPATAPGSQPAPAPLAVVDPLPSWNDGATKQAIVAFVERVTRQGSADFVPPAERIATFDNDGTLWSEQPMYFQFAFALDRVKALAPQHPEWKGRQPFAAVLAGDVKGAASAGEKGLMDLLAATHTGNTTEEFERIVTDWIATAKHPKFDRPYTDLVFQPMLEVLQYLRANGFKTFIVSGGGVEFMRPWVERVYGVPPEQVVGSRAKVRYEVRDGKPELRRLAEVDFVDDKAGKPVGINQVIGRRPTAAFGNSDGDFEMLEWTTSAAGPRFGLLVHHTDGEREWAYDRASPIGQLVRGLDEGPERGWIVADMKRDWKIIYPFQK
jgi:phosphoglycolate phosphatase-like HAD superfamily hydrolase